MKSMDVQKGNLASTPSPLFPKWDVEFHVHVDASCIAPRAMLTPDGVEGMDHLITFASWRLSKEKKNYSTVEHVGLAMV